MGSASVAGGNSACPGRPLAVHAPPCAGRGLPARVFANRAVPVIQSLPMHRWFFGFFFFPRHLAEGNG